MNERVKIIRKHFGLTLDKFGEKLGLGKSSVSQIENGKCALTDANIKSICREFNVSENWLRTGEGEMFVPMDEADEIYAWLGRALRDDQMEFKERIFKMLMKLTPEQWTYMEKQLRFLAGLSDDDSEVK